MRFGATALAALAAAVACESSVGPGREITLPITRLEMPATVPPGTTLVIKVTVTFGGCRSFQGLDVTRTPGRVVFVAVGRDVSGPGVTCTDELRTDVVEYDAEPPLEDPFTAVARQPDGSEITRVARVQ